MSNFDPTLFIDNRLIFKNPQSGQIKKIKVGFCWPGLFFPPIVLFVKGLIGYGFAVLGICVILPLIASPVYNNWYWYDEGGHLLFLLGAVVIGVNICVGLFANKWHAKTLIEKGWILQNADAAKDTLKDKIWDLNSSPTSGSNPTYANASEVKSAVSLANSADSFKSHVASEAPASDLQSEDIKLLMSQLQDIAEQRRKIQEQQNEPDLQYYAQAEQEVDDGTFDKGFWSKALINVNGKEELRKIEYMKIRARQLQDIEVQPKLTESLEQEKLLQKEIERLQEELQQQKKIEEEQQRIKKEKEQQPFSHLSEEQRRQLEGFMKI